MFVSAPVIPHGLPDYEVHQHLHYQFDRSDRVFLYRRIGDGLRMLSIVPPKCPHALVPVERFRPQHPLSFCADLVITGAKFVRGQSGRRYDIRDHDARRGWLKAKLDGVADVPFARFNERWIVLGNGTRRLVATATGVIRITDAARFAALVQSGIGRGRAFGCGLIWIPEVME